MKIIGIISSAFVFLSSTSAQSQFEFQTLRCTISTLKGFALSCSDKTGSEPRAFALPNPNRVILDIAASTREGVTSITPPINPLVSKIRIGAHPGKIRIVFDMQSSGIPHYSVERRAQGFTLWIGKEGTETPIDRSSIINAPTPSPTLLSPPTPTPLETLSPQATSTALPIATPTSPPHVEATSTQTPLPTQAEATPISAPTVMSNASATDVFTPIPPTLFAVVGIDFVTDSMSQSPTVQIRLSRPGAFTLTRRDAESYVVRISDVDLVPDYLLLPFFPPHDFVGFESLLIERGKNRDYLIAIRVGAGTRLKAVRKDSTIVVTAEGGKRIGF